METQGAHVALDLADASYVDAAVVGIVRDASTLSESAGGDLTVVTRDPRIRAQLRFDRHVRVVTSLADAIPAA